MDNVSSITPQVESLRLEKGKREKGKGKRGKRCSAVLGVSPLSDCIKKGKGEKAVPHGSKK
jgi:hypothetical protein